MAKRKKEKRTALGVCASVAKGVDQILNALITVAICVVLAFAGWGLWDSYRLYAGAVSTSYEGIESDHPTLAELHALYPDTCAWLKLDDTKIDYPVVQGKDNLEYINKTVDGKFSLTGAVFVDARNKNDFSDAYSVLYAHHVTGDALFGQLPEFKKKDFFDAHSSGTLETLKKMYDLEIFATVHSDAYDDMIFNPIRQKGSKDMKSLLKYIKKEAVQYRDIGVKSGDRIIGMTTCYNATTDGRIAVYARMVPGKQ